MKKRKEINKLLLSMSKNTVNFGEIYSISMPIQGSALSK